MPKFRIKMKLQGLELEIEGAREDVPLITQNLGQQLSGMLQPAGAIVEGEVVGRGEQTETNGAKPEPRRTRRRRQSAPAASASRDGQSKESPIDWLHDPSKYGTPKQVWSTSSKSLWLLYVVSQEAQVRELSGQRIASTFNKHFRQAWQILPHNVNRDLGRLKIKEKTPPVSEDTTSNPSKWFLTEEGVRSAQKLVAEALGRTET